MADPGDADDRAAKVAEIKKTLREFQKQRRLERIARGEGSPRTYAEMELWLKGSRERFKPRSIEGEHDE